MSMAIDPDELAALEEERAFLLRSLRDLDAERAAGDVDDHDYRTLRDGYTKRAADVLRRIEAGQAHLPSPPARPWTRRLAVAAVVAVIAAGAGWMVARSSGQRLAGDEITGGARTGDVAVMLAEARRALGVDPGRAIELYQQVLDEQPDHPEALTYFAWLLYTASSEADDDLRAEAVAASRRRLQDAIAADPRYPDPHCFLAIIAANHDGDDATALTEAEQCLALDPPQQLRDLMNPFLEGLDR